MDAANDFDAGDHGLHQLGARSANGFSQRQRRRDGRDAGVASDQVVELEHVAHIAVDPRGSFDWKTLPATQDRGLLRTAARRLGSQQLLRFDKARA